MKGHLSRCPLCMQLLTMEQRKLHHLTCSAANKPRESNCSYTRLCRKLNIKGF